jgi:hypothetical protein
MSGVGVFPEGEKTLGWRIEASLLRQTDFAYQFSEPRVGTQGIE